jgi:capsular exopolysaccharide synthesis family protein
MHDAHRDAPQELPEGGHALVPAVNGAVGLVRRDPYYPIGLEVPEGEGADLGLIIRQYLHMLVKRKWLILSITLVFFVLGGVRALMRTPLYSATVRIQIDREPVKIVEGGSTSPSEEGGADFLRTQYELLKSRAMAERVSSQLRIHEDSDFFKPINVSPLALLLGRPNNEKLPASALQERAVGIILSNMTILPVPMSRLVDLAYLDPNPARAQRIANAYAEAYVASTLDKRFQANSYAKAFLEDQIKQLKIRLEESEKAVLDFAEREKMVEVSEKSSIAESNLAAANAALGQLISERIKSEQLWQQVEKATAISLPQILTNHVIDLLRAQRKALETEYQEKLENFKPSYPAMVQISAKLKEVDRQLAAEIETIRNSLKAAYESALSQENEMKARMESLREVVLDLQKKGIQYGVLKREVDTNRGLYNSLLQRYKEVGIAGGVGTSNVFIVDRAVLPGGPSEPNIPRFLVLSLALGFGLGVASAILLELLDDRVRAPEELEQISGLATLGIVPRAESSEQAIEALADPRSAMSEAYRSFATALQFSTESGLPRSIAITSSGPGEGKSTTVLAIARYFAQMGLRVLLVDADLRRPSLHLKQRLDNSIGFSNFLTGAALPPEVIQKTDHPNLAFMASGPLPPNAADLLSGTRIYSLISLGSEVFDLIIFDAPPLLGLADAQLIASATAATVFVVGAGDQRKGMIRSALRRLQLARVSVLGSVLTKFHPKTVGYAYAYSYKYGYGYSYGYGGDAYSYSKQGAADEGQRKLSKPSVN